MLIMKFEDYMFLKVKELYKENKELKEDIQSLEDDLHELIGEKEELEKILEIERDEADCYIDSIKEENNDLKEEIKILKELLKRREVTLNEKR